MTEFCVRKLDAKNYKSTPKSFLRYENSEEEFLAMLLADSTNKIVHTLITDLQLISSGKML